MERDQSHDVRRNADARGNDRPVDALQHARVVRRQVHDAGQSPGGDRAAHDRRGHQVEYDERFVGPGQRQRQYEQPVDHVAETARQFAHVRRGHGAGPDQVVARAAERERRRPYAQVGYARPNARLETAASETDNRYRISYNTRLLALENNRFNWVSIRTR